MTQRGPPHMRLIDDRFVPRSPQGSITLPIKGLIHDATQGREGGAVPFVEREILLRVADLVAEDRIVPMQRPADSVGVWIEQKLVGVETQAFLRLVRSVNPIAVQVPRFRIRK